MEIIKKIFKNAFITSLVILGYGVISRSNLIYIGMFGGSLLSILGFYMIALDSKKSIHSSSPMKASVLGYLRRYFIYAIFLGGLTKYFGISMLVCSAIGLLNIKFNIFISTLSDNILMFKEKYLK